MPDGSRIYLSVCLRNYYHKDDTGYSKPLRRTDKDCMSLCEQWAAKAVEYFSKVTPITTHAKKETKDKSQ